MDRVPRQTILVALSGIAFTWFFWLSGNPLMGHGCTHVLAASDVLGPGRPYHARSIFAPGLLFYVVQGALSRLLGSLNTARLLMTAYVFSLFFGFRFMARDWDTHPAAFLLVFPLVFNGAVCKGDLPLVLAAGLFPWAVVVFQRFLKQPDTRRNLGLMGMDLVIFYGDLVVFIGILVLQATMLIQRWDRKRYRPWIAITSAALLPLFVWTAQGGLSPWAHAFLHTGPGFLHGWYDMLGDCFRGPIDEWAFAMSGFAILIALAGLRKRPGNLQLPVFVMAAFMLLLPSGTYNGLTLAARMATPAALLVIAAVAGQRMRWPRLFVVFAGLSAILAVAGANLGMVRWMRESRAYTRMSNMIPPHSVIDEQCSRKFDRRAVMFPGWGDWSACVAAQKACELLNPAVLPLTWPVSLVSSNTSTAKHFADYILICKNGRRTAMSPGTNYVKVLSYGQWLLFRRSMPANRPVFKIPKSVHRPISRMRLNIRRLDLPFGLMPGKRSTRPKRLLKRIKRPENR